MTAVADVALFALGVYLCVRSLAALYAVLDLWYTIRTAYGRVVRGILGWCGATGALAAALDEGRRRAFLLGMAAYILFFLGLRLVLSLYLRQKRAALAASR